jgi:hypothetical protein
MEAQTLSFTIERETKNTVRYQEQTAGKPPAIGTLYVQKWLLGENPPPSAFRDDSSRATLTGVPIRLEATHPPEGVTMIALCAPKSTRHVCSTRMSCDGCDLGS